MKSAFLIVLFLFVLIGVVRAEEKARPRHEISVSVKPAQNLLTGTVAITLPKGKSHTIVTGSLKITEAILEGKPLEAEPDAGALKLDSGGELRISFEGVFTGGGEVEDLENVGVVAGGVVSEQGVSLLGLWYPQAETEDGLAYYSLTVLVPEGFAAVSEAEEITSAEVPGGTEFSFKFPYPTDGISLAAAPYVVSRDTVNGTDIYGYFFAEDAHLAETYMEYTKKYIKMYEELIGEFPFKRFSVVENVLPTGYSMPTYTLLGRTVVRLPFIVETSLGHEILHQWLGNHVYADYAQGNWVEGLTTYLSDHLYREQEGKGAAYRKKTLLDYQNYVHPENELPLREFLQRRDFATRAVGYGKGAMLFHMLRNEVDRQAFRSALKTLVRGNKFERASWEDVRAAFEEASGEDLAWFFRQWLDRKGVISFEVREPRSLLLDGRHRVSFRLLQKGEPYRFKLPVVVTTENGPETRTVEVKDEKQGFTIEVAASPRELVLDPGYDIMRELRPAEVPPVVSALTGAEKRLLILPAEGAEKYETLTGIMEENGFAVKPEDEVKDEDLRGASVLVAGLESPVIRRLFGGAETFLSTPGIRLEEWKSFDGFALLVRKNPLSPAKAVAVAYAGSREEVDLAARKIFRYGNYSALRFTGGANVQKATAPSEDGMRHDLSLQVLGVAPRGALTLEEVIRGVIDAPVIYVGEGHTFYQDHKIQLEVIKALHEAGRSFGIGMEMFQQPFQQPLDDYLAGEIGEKEFLRASEYFKRWKFNYHLYREILDYARAGGIPVVALNQKSEIIRKVAQGGLDALDEEEKKDIPPDMDMSDFAYRERLGEVFRQHKNSRTFENFYQAQVLWDETMAHAVDEFLGQHPGWQMVVIAGAGHVAHGSGIPRRARRLNGMDYAILVTARNSGIEPGIADYVLFAEDIAAPESPALGVQVDTKDGRLVIKEVSPGSPAEKAGLKKNDVFLSADGLDIEGIEDLKAALFGKEPGDTMAVRVKRKRFFARDRELGVTVRFP